MTKPEKFTDISVKNDWPRTVLINGQEVHGVADIRWGYDQGGMPIVTIVFQNARFTSEPAPIIVSSSQE